MLRNIALEATNLGAARGAPSSCSRSRGIRRRNRIVVDVAKTGPEPCASPRFASSAASAARMAQELLQVYSTANAPVKQQVVLSLGQRADTTSLLRIAQAENDDRGCATPPSWRSGGPAVVSSCESVLRAPPRDTRQAIIRGLFNWPRRRGPDRGSAGQEKDRGRPKAKC